MKIYVTNLSYEITEEELHLALEPFGQVKSATINKDMDSGQSKGFGSVEMGSEAEGLAAINGLNGKELKGKVVSLNEARPQSESFGFGGGYASSKGEYVGKGVYGGEKGAYGGGKGSYGSGKGGYSGEKRGQGGGRGGRGRSGR